MLSSTNLTGATVEHRQQESNSVGSPSAVSESASLHAGVAARTSGQHTVSGIVLVLFVIATAVTFYFARTMSTGMAMPGRWTMSAIWMTMPGQTELEAAVMFALMWLAMMVAMMLPSALPMLLVYRRVMFLRRGPRCSMQTWLVGVGYFTVWAAVGVAAYACGLVVTRLTMASEAVSRLVPVASGVALAVGGTWQFTPWKFACLKHCRDPIHLLARYLDREIQGAFGFGLHHGAYCAGCCWGLMLMMLVLGVMNLGAMILVAAVIAGEKLLMRGEIVARGVGGAAILAGAWLAAHSLL
jgi:predicted metal-binding membrane protein